MNTIDTVIRIVSEHFELGNAKITEHTQFSELDADSLDLVDLISEIEDEFDISVEDEDIDSISSVSDVVKLIEKYKSK